MDPFSIAAVLGLIVAGKNLSKDSAYEEDEVQQRNPREHTDDFLETRNITPDIGRRIGSTILPPKNEIRSLQTPQLQTPFGMPVYNLSGREPINNKMNNLAPVHRQNVGPGLGVSSNIDATGGFQQYFRILPNNPNDERLISLKGNYGGPSNPVVKNGNAMTGELTQFPEKVYHHDPIQSSGQGQGGALRGQEERPEYVKTARPTVRQETGYRQEGDDVQYGQSSYIVKQPYADLSDKTTFKQLPRITDNRSKPDRAANGQNMNVRADPLDAGGLVTNLRREYDTNAPGVPDGTRSQQWVDSEYYSRLNGFKSNPNPWSTNLSLAKDVLGKNAYAISIN
jgi:hypothetical protein